MKQSAPGARLSNRRGGVAGIALAVFAASTIVGLGGVCAAEPASTDWVRGHGSAARLIGGLAAARGEQPRGYAGLELAIADGWKTYWRHPGDDGGVPPYFDFAGSKNLKRAEVLYPAPLRFMSAGSVSVGYKRQVVFPIRVTAQDPAKPVALNVKLEYGICREICIPAEARLSLKIPAATAGLVKSERLAAAMQRVPVKGQQPASGDPQLRAGRAVLAGPKPSLRFEVAYPGGAQGADLFIEGPEGVFVPQPQRLGNGAGGVVTFEVDLSKGVDIKDVAGKALRLTMVSDKGQSESDWVVK